jgi:hypothetical protein
MRTDRLQVVTVSLAAVVLAAVMVACREAAHEPPVAPASPSPTTTPAQASGIPCPEAPPCGDDCSNYPFAPTECWTTEYGPAKADVVTSPKNFLYCSGGAYALCFFSGPPEKTGTNPDNRALPCVVNGDHADCTCQVYTSGPYFVDINAILNLGAYYQTIHEEACGKDGASCANLENCGPDGRAKGCADRRQAPVCAYVEQQNANDPTTSLMPKADLVSAFSFAMDGDYGVGSTRCDQPWPYAGCMTAPCTLPAGAASPPADGDPIQCQCPIYTGVFQIGQDGQSCEIPSVDGVDYVWSAANTVSGGGGQ